MIFSFNIFEKPYLCILVDIKSNSVIYCYCYKALTKGGVHSFPWRNIWKVKVPSRGFFYMDCHYRKDPYFG